MLNTIKNVLAVSINLLLIHFIERILFLAFRFEYHISMKVFLTVLKLYWCTLYCTDPFWSASSFADADADLDGCEGSEDDEHNDQEMVRKTHQLLGLVRYLLPTVGSSVWTLKLGCCPVLSNGLVSPPPFPPFPSLPLPFWKLERRCGWWVMSTVALSAKGWHFGELFLYH